MEQIVEKITQGLLQKLPEQAQPFTPDELLSSGIPYIVVETMRRNVASTVNAELTLPDSEWLQLNHENVQNAWRDFVEVSGNHLQIPESKLSHLLKEAVDQCLELAVKPRQSVPEIIFRTRETIDLKTARERVDSIEVNKQLGLALLRYMEKKEKEEIGFEQASELITKVDERLVEDYHPLKWAQALKPVFNLAGPAVNPELFQIFFEDKEKSAYAKKFTQLEEPLNESEFIEALSSADVLDIEGYEDEQPELFVPVEEESEPEKVVEIDTTSDDEKIITSDDETVSEETTAQEEVSAQENEEVDETVAEGSLDEEKPVEFEDPKYQYQEVSEEDFEGESPGEDGERDENIVDLFSKIREVDHFERDDDNSRPVISLVKDDEDDDESDEKDNITLLSKFMFDESDEESFTSEDDGDETEPRESPQKKPTSIYDEMNLVKDDGVSSQKDEEFPEDAQEHQDDDEEELSFKIESSEEKNNDVEEDVFFEKEENDVDSENENEEEDQPMWRSFLERDDLDTDSGYEYDEDDEQVEVGESEEDEDDGFIEEPIYDLTSDKADHKENVNKISGWLDDEKDRFVDEIFRGSEFAYEQALADITDFENWKAASMYLESEVFSRNKIDVYDEVAVDFTDRLHSYFIENNTNHKD